MKRRRRTRKRGRHRRRRRIDSPPEEREFYRFRSSSSCRHLSPDDDAVRRPIRDPRQLSRGNRLYLAMRSRTRSTRRDSYSPGRKRSCRASGSEFRDERWVHDRRSRSRSRSLSPINQTARSLSPINRTARSLSPINRTARFRKRRRLSRSPSTPLVPTGEQISPREFHRTPVRVFPADHERSNMSPRFKPFVHKQSEVLPNQRAAAVHPVKFSETFGANPSALVSLGDVSNQEISDQLASFGVPLQAIEPVVVVMSNNVVPPRAPQPIFDPSPPIVTEHLPSRIGVNALSQGIRSRICPVCAQHFYRTSLCYRHVRVSPDERHFIYRSVGDVDPLTARHFVAARVSSAQRTKHVPAARKHKHMPGPPPVPPPGAKASSKDPPSKHRRLTHRTSRKGSGKRSKRKSKGLFRHYPFLPLSKSEILRSQNIKPTTRKSKGVDYAILPQLSFTIALERVKSFFEKEDPSLAVLSAHVLLRDPVSLNRITIPVKTLSCKHIQCFDLETHLNLRRAPGADCSKTWSCPTCGLIATPNRLRICTFFQKILIDTGKDIHVVDVQADGSFVPVFDDNQQPKLLDVIDLT